MRLSDIMLIFRYSTSSIVKIEMVVEFLPSDVESTREGASPVLHTHIARWLLPRAPTLKEAAT